MTASTLSLFKACTVSIVELVTPPKLAVIVVAAAVRAVASPFEPAVLLMVATQGDDELQVTEVVISFVELSE